MAEQKKTNEALNVEDALTQLLKQSKTCLQRQVYLRCYLTMKRHLLMPSHFLSKLTKQLRLVLLKV